MQFLQNVKKVHFNGLQTFKFQNVNLLFQDNSAIKSPSWFVLAGKTYSNLYTQQNSCTACWVWDC